MSASMRLEHALHIHQIRPLTIPQRVRPPPRARGVKPTHDELIRTRVRAHADDFAAPYLVFGTLDGDFLTSFDIRFREFRRGFPTAATRCARGARGARCG